VDPFRPTSPQKLPIILTAKLAFRNVSGNMRMFFTLATIPMVLSLICSLIGPVMLMGNGGEQNISLAGAAGFFIVALATLFFPIVFIVAWHRFLITGTRESGARVQFAVGKREFRYFGFLLLLSVGMAIPLVALMAVIMPAQSGQGSPSIASLAIFALLVFVYVLIAVRVSLRFPAIAVDRDKGFVAAWRQTKGSGWRLFFTLVIVCIPFAILNALMAEVESGSLASTVILLGVLTVVSYLQSALVASVLALAYTWLVEAGEGTEIERVS